MDVKSAVNITICAVGALILLVHVVDLIIKKNKRSDEKWLLVFFGFTVLHFVTYMVYLIIKQFYTSDTYIMSFYTIFYIYNNLEILVFFLYTVHYIKLSTGLKKRLYLINNVLFWIFFALDIVNIFTGIFFYAKDGEYQRSSAMIYSQIYQFIMFAIVFILTIFNKKLNKREKIAFFIYCVFPLIAIILQNIFKGYAIAYLSIIISIEIMFFFVNVQKNIQLAEEEEKNKQAQIKIMLSQIQPHFIYNSLSAISTLITIDPDKAQDSLDRFTEYLRRNLSSLTETNLIPFKDELRHIKTYVELEKLRFNDRINVVFDIGTTDFNVPPLTIQPIVENAIKHGILKKLEGGIVTLTTYETDTNYIVEVKDNGIGFDITKIDFDKNVHFGLKNIGYRISQMTDGDLKISSKVDVGTKITVTFKKER